MSTQLFTIRHATMYNGTRYPPGYEPYHLGNGSISYFVKGACCLSAFNRPSEAMAVYSSGSFLSPPGFTYEAMDKHNYYWPQPEEAYIQFLTVI